MTKTAATPTIKLPPASLTLSVIIVSYNTAELTQQTLISMIDGLTQDKHLNTSSEIIVVDNNSQDDSVHRIRTLQKATKQIEIKLIPSAKNLGFGNANNLALTKARGEFFFFLNSDTQLQPHAVSHLIDTLQHFPQHDTTADLGSTANKLDRLGILAAQLLNPDGTIQYQGGALPSLLSLGCHMLMLDDLPLIGKFLPSTQHTGRRGKDSSTGQGLLTQGWVGGTALVVKRAVIEEIGPWDPDIFMYGEDIDLCWRARHHHWDVAIDPAAQVIHYGSASSSSETALRGEFIAYLYLWAKHQPLWQRPFVRNLLKLGAVQRQLIFTLLGNAQKSAIYARISHEVLR